jgi:hypothetical protein
VFGCTLVEMKGFIVDAVQPARFNNLFGAYKIISI